MKFDAVSSDSLADPQSVLDRRCSLTLRTRSWPRSSTRMTRRSRRWAAYSRPPEVGCTGAVRRSCSGMCCVPYRPARPPVGQTWHLPALVRTPGWALGWAESRKLAPVWHSSRMPGQRMRRPAIAAAAQLAEEVGSMVPDLPTPAWQALLEELKTVAQHCPDRPDQ
jgi:hypothetical protein